MEVFIVFVFIVVVFVLVIFVVVIFVLVVSVKAQIQKFRNTVFNQKSPFHSAYGQQLALLYMCDSRVPIPMSASLCHESMSRHRHAHTQTHINIMTRPGLGARAE